MEDSMICLDTSILIDFFRKRKKENSVLYQLTKRHKVFAVSVITEYEIYTGSTNEQKVFWEGFFLDVTVLPFDSETNKNAVEIYKNLKQSNKLIEIPNIFIGAIAIKHKLKLATLNTKHFERIKDLELCF
jgi:tRNA(fMet)-specific endonuclease VapC